MMAADCSTESRRDFRDWWGATAILVMHTASAPFGCLAASRRGYIVKKGGSRTTRRAARCHHLLGTRLAPVDSFQSPQRQPERMAADVSKHLDRAKRFLEKNRVEDAIEAYLAVLDEAPQHQEATQALGDLYARMDQPDRAAVYYGLLFDLLVEPKDETKALAIYNRFLRAGHGHQPPERIARYAFLQQRQNHPDEAIEQYTKAAELFTTASRDEDALFCWERIAQLDPENLSRQLRLAEAAERNGKNALAARAFLRAGQLASASGAPADALHLLGRAYKLAPQERSVGLLYAQANLQAGNAVRAAALLEPFATSKNDAAFIATFSDALMRSGNLERARELLDRLLREKNEGMTQLFDLADRYVAASQDQKATEILLMLKRRMFADKRQKGGGVSRTARGHRCVRLSQSGAAGTAARASG